MRKRIKTLLGKVIYMKKRIKALLVRVIYNRILPKYFRRIVLRISSIDKKIVDLVDEINREAKITMGFNQARILYSLVISTQKVLGDIAEVGVYRGGSAKLICEVKGGKILHLFDTFEGHPKPSEFDLPTLYKGKYAASEQNVRQYLAGYKEVYFYKGVFPETSEPVKDKTFSLIHLDADLYKSTRDSLEFFYPRVNKGGAILVQNYLANFGVKKAVDEFFEDKIEPIVQVTPFQALIVKI